jgi:membrane-anchored mycosin MYCP
MPEIVILEADAGQVPRLKQCRSLKSLDDVLPDDDQSREWRRVIAAFHSAGLKGAGQTIAVIDTGYDPKTRLLSPAILKGGCVDLTGEGLPDQNGHGTSVSLLLRACAPEANLIHIKAFDKNGVCAGKNASQRESVFEKALTLARDHGAHLLNISAGLHRSTHDESDYGHHAGVCLCPMCTKAKQIAIEAGVSIFAAGGNQGRSNRSGGDDWWCPANAPCVVPVFGFAGGQPIYDPWSVYPTGIGAAGNVRPGQKGGWRARGILQEIWHYLTESRPPWVGNSFATPLVTGTAALVRQIFALCGMKRPFQPNTPDSKNAHTF